MRYGDRQSAAIASVLTCSELIDAEFAVTECAEKLADAMKELTGVLARNSAELYRDQRSGRRLQDGARSCGLPNGDGRYLPRSPAQTYHGGFINLEMAASASADVRYSVEGLWDAMRMPATLPQSANVDDVR